MQINKLPSAPNVDTSVTKPTWDWLIKMGTIINQLVAWINGTDLSIVPSHASTHASGGSDPVTPASIGALSALPSGSVVQIVNYETGAVVTGTTTIPNDDTIPQNTEGTQFLSASITPKSVSNLLLIDVVLCVSPSVSTELTAAIFQDSTANSLACTVLFAANGVQFYLLNFKHKMTAGTTSATTFNVKCGGSGVSTITLNGYSGNRLYGGVMASSITITEIAA